MSKPTKLEFGQVSLGERGTVHHMANRPAPEGAFIEIKVDNERAAEERVPGPLDASLLYPDLEGQDSITIHAMLLLKKCIGFMLGAEGIDPSEDYIGYDEEIMKAKDCLRKLFRLREISEGFGATVIAILSGIWNLDGEPLAPNQMAVVLEALSKLRQKPMLHFNSAMALIDALEDSNLNITPSFVDGLLPDFGGLPK